VWRALLALGVLVSARLAGASELIAVPDRVDHVFDPTRGILYISTSSGRIQRYHVPTQLLLRPFRVGADLRGLDITPDGEWIYATEYAHGPDRGVLHKVSAANGTVSNIPFPRYALSEGGGWDVSIGAYDRGLTTTDYEGSGLVPLRTLILPTDKLVKRRDINPENELITERSLLTRGANRSIIFLQESNTTGGFIHSYETASNTFVAHAETGMLLDTSAAAVSGDGALVAMEMPGWVAVFDSRFHLVEVLNVASGGLLFDPARDRLFVAEVNRDQIVAYDTSAWSATAQWDVGEDIFGGNYYEFQGVMSATLDGNTVFLSTDSGIRVIDVAP
jgi:hypothetical protein